MSDLLTRHTAAIMNTYGQPKLALESASGVYLYDVSGKQYLDLLGGVAVNALGYAHPKIVDAVSAQIAQLPHVSNYFTSDTTVSLAEKLLKHIPGQPGGKVFFTNSGTESTETALKLSRLTGRTELVCLTGGFHGRSFGALSVTAQPAKQEPFLPLLPQVTAVPFNDCYAIEAAVTEKTAAVIVEPILGEGGVIPAEVEFLQCAREVTLRRGALLIVDEIQTGVGRTGTFYCCESAGITPDVITLAKGLGGGLPLGAVIATGEAAGLLSPGQHGSTFGGNPVAAAAGNVVVDIVGDSQFLQHVTQVGSSVAEQLRAIGSPLITEVRARGLLIGISFGKPIAKLVESLALKEGFILSTTDDATVRLAPPLIITTEQFAPFISALRTIVTTIEKDI